jgi:hypothetical protein
MAPSAIAEMGLSFFSGLCIERNLKSGKGSSTRKIENFMTALRSSSFTASRWSVTTRNGMADLRRHKAAGRRQSESRVRENRTHGLTRGR